jgi:hypothetical protein
MAAQGQQSTRDAWIADNGSRVLSDGVRDLWICVHPGIFETSGEYSRESARGDDLSQRAVILPEVVAKDADPGVEGIEVGVVASPRDVGAPRRGPTPDQVVLLLRGEHPVLGEDGQGGAGAGLPLGPAGFLDRSDGPFDDVGVEPGTRAAAGELEAVDPRLRRRGLAEKRAGQLEIDERRRPGGEVVAALARVLGPAAAGDVAFEHHEPVDKIGPGRWGQERRVGAHGRPTSVILRLDGRFNLSAAPHDPHRRRDDGAARQAASRQRVR